MSTLQLNLKKVKHYLENLPRLQRRIIGVVLILLILAALTLAVVGIVGHFKRAHGLQLVSGPVTDNKSMPPIYTCDGQNINPPFTFSKIPAGTQSFAVLMEDTTKKKSSVQWMVWNIPVKNASILEGIRPPGTVARNSAGNFGYTGPCPTPGSTDSYTIHLYALNTATLSINSSASATDFQNAVKSHILDEGDLFTSYTRAKK